MKVRKADVADLIDRTFPEYKGRRFVINVAEKVTFHDTVWGDGTRNYYCVVKIDTGEAGRLRALGPFTHAFNAVEGMTFPIPPNVIVAEHAIFCGKDMGLRFYVRPDNMPKRLTETN